jgi:phosphatidylglycerophosphate synthase
VQNKKLGNALKNLGISPNQWTALSLLFGIITLYLLAKESFGFAALAFALAAICDAFDGAVARATGKASKLGAYLDTIADRYVEFFVIVGLFFANLFPYLLPASFWLLLYLFGSATTTYAKAATKEKELTKSEISGGILERPERVLLLFIGLVLAPFSKIYLTYMIIILAILSNITALQRIKIAANLPKKVKQ